MKKRMEWVDSAKGLGIFLVVLGHALPANAAAATVIWAFHMPLFFFLSGVTAKASTPQSVPNAVRNLKSIIVPYLFFSGISIVFWLMAKGLLASPGAWTEQLRQMAYGVAGPDHLMAYNVPLWFFTCLLMVRICFIAITAMLRRTPLQVACAVLLVLFAHAYVFGHFVSILWNLDVALVALLFFVAGYVLNGVIGDATEATKSTQMTFLVLATLLLTASVATNGRVDMNGRGFGNPVWFYVGAFSGIAIIVNIAGRLCDVVFLKVLGRASIVIFPLHLLFALLPHRVMPTIAWYIFRITHSSIFASIGMSILEIGVCIPVYFAIGKWAPFLIGKSTKARHRNSGGEVASLEMAAAAEPQR